MKSINLPLSNSRLANALKERASRAQSTVHPPRLTLRHRLHRLLLRLARWVMPKQEFEVYIPKSVRQEVSERFSRRRTHRAHDDSVDQPSR